MGEPNNLNHSTNALFESKLMVYMDTNCMADLDGYSLGAYVCEACKNL